MGTGDKWNSMGPLEKYNTMVAFQVWLFETNGMFYWLAAPHVGFKDVTVSSRMNVFYASI